MSAVIRLIAAVTSRRESIMLQRSLRPYYIMGTLIAVLLFISAGAGLLGAAGLFGGDIYRPFLHNESLLIGLPIQDAVSFLVAPLLLAAMFFTGRGSRRALVAWAGLLVYVIYYYAFYVLGYIFNAYYPAYLALVSLATYSLIGLLSGVDVAQFRSHVSERMPARLISIILAIMLLIVPLWVSALLQSLATRTVPDIALVWVLDLGFLLPAIAYAAVQLWRRRAIGYLLGGVLLIKATASGVLLTLGTLRQMQMNLGGAVEQLAFYIYLMVTGIVALTLYMRNLQDAPVTAAGRATL
jgi:hypothetical protein